VREVAPPRDHWDLGEVLGVVRLGEELFECSLWEEEAGRVEGEGKAETVRRQDGWEWGWHGVDGDGGGAGMGVSVELLRGAMKPRRLCGSAANFWN
jgi:hypothetical protein